MREDHSPHRLALRLSVPTALTNSPSLSKTMRPVPRMMHLVDEAQDYLPQEIEAFRRLAKVIFAVADPKQKLYDGPDSMEALRRLTDGQRHLRYHYRCGRSICRVADELGKRWPKYEELTPTSNYDEKRRPSSVESIRCPDPDDEAAQVIDKLRIQLQAYPDELIGVIAPRQEEAEAFWSRVSVSDVGPAAVFHTDRSGLLFSSSKNIFVGTMHSAKGLEFRTLHIVGGDFLGRFAGRQRFLAFTAVTRAKTSLSVYFREALPGYFEKALQVLRPIPDLPLIKDIFGRKQ